MSKERPDANNKRIAFVVASPSGEILQQNERATSLLGDGVGLDCWQLVGVNARGRDVPCAPGCTRRLVEGCGADSVCQRVTIGQERYQLSCMSLGDRTVSVLAPLDPARRDRGERRLTARETEVLELMATGLPLGAIGRELGISERTVRTHVEHMRAKLGVSSQGALVAQGYERGYLG